MFGVGPSELAIVFAGGLWGVDPDGLPEQGESPGLHPGVFNGGREVWPCGAVAGSVCTDGVFSGAAADELDVDTGDSATELRSSVSEPSQYRTATSPAARPAMTPRATSTLRIHVSRLRVPVILTGMLYRFGERRLQSPVRAAAINDSRRKRGRQRTKPVSNLSEMRLDGGAVTQKSKTQRSSSIFHLAIWQARKFLRSGASFTRHDGNGPRKTQCELAGVLNVA